VKGLQFGFVKSPLHQLLLACARCRAFHYVGPTA